MQLSTGPRSWPRSPIWKGTRSTKTEVCLLLPWWFDSNPDIYIIDAIQYFEQGGFKYDDNVSEFSTDTMSEEIKKKVDQNIFDIHLGWLSPPHSTSL